MKRFPHYRQHEQIDCGPTCLRMIDAYYGKRYSLERLREQCHISRLGVSMLGISEAAEKIGMRSMGVEISFKQLAEDAPLPCIVHWNQEHFVVVYRCTEKQVWVADPATSKLKYPLLDKQPQKGTGHRHCPATGTFAGVLQRRRR